LEGPRSAGIVFEPGTADGGKIFIAVDIELDLAFAPPVPPKSGERDVGAYIRALTSNAVDDDMILPSSGRVCSAPLSVQVPDVLIEDIAL
jgi:hypothetical protein